MRGVEFEACGKVYTLKFSSNNICRAEKSFGMTFGEILKALNAMGEKIDFTFVRALFARGLGANVTEEEAGDVMDEIGGVTATAEKIGEAIADAFPDAGDETEKKATAAA